VTKIGLVPGLPTSKWRHKRINAVVGRAQPVRKAYAAEAM